MNVWPNCDEGCPVAGHPDGEYCRADEPGLWIEPAPPVVALDAGDDTGAIVAHRHRLYNLLVTTQGLDAIPEPVALVDDVLYLDSLAYLIGKPGNGKSFVALDIAGCVGGGDKWQGFQTWPGEVWYLAAEGVSGIKQRVRAWEQAMGRPMTNVVFLPVAVQVDNHQEWAALVSLCAERQPVLIVLDTQARITVGLEENSARDMGYVIARLENLRQATRACVLVVHHQGRNGDHMRGSSALDAGTNTVIRVTKDEEILTVTCEKQKDAAEFDEFKLRMVPTGQSVVLAATDGRVNRGGIPKWVRDWWDTHEREPVSISVLVKSGVVTEPTFHRSKRDLLNEGVIVREGKGNQTRYRLTVDPTVG